MYDAIGDLMDPETMTIREMCDAFDVTPRTLRFYESKELLFPIRDGQKRLFTRRDRARLKLILRGKRLGFTLDEIRKTFVLYDKPGGARIQLEYYLDLLARKRAKLEQQRQDIDAALAELDDSEQRCRELLEARKEGAAGVG